MKTEKSQIEKLLQFKQQDKFSSSAWNEKGLTPSNEKFCKQLTILLNSTADNLMKATSDNTSSKQLKILLKSELGKFNQFDLDTEEKEIVCDLFHELATIINVDFKDNLNKWLYGSSLAALINSTPTKIVQTLEQACNKCGSPLQTLILRKEEGIPDTSWLVAKCNRCNNLNLVSLGPNVKEMRFVNYQWIDTLSKEEYSEEQALTKLKHIK